MEPEEFQRMRGIAFDRGRSGPAGLNAAHVDALNYPAVRKQLENLGLQMPPKDKLTPDGRRLAEGRNCKMVADDQGRQCEGGLAA
jgi:hypothetical protein